jgi:hypothetical protein
MSVSLTIGSETFQYPQEGTKPGWGEEATAWAVAVTNKLATLSGPNDINCTCVVIANNQSCAQNVGTGASALSFPVSAVRSFEVCYAVTRGTSVESGQMYGVYDGSDWSFRHEHTDCAGVCFQITPTGQIQYFSTDDVAGTIKFRARTIDQ